MFATEPRNCEQTNYSPSKTKIGTKLFFEMKINGEKIVIENYPSALSFITQRLAKALNISFHMLNYRMLLLPDAGAVHVNEAGMVDLEIGNKKLTHSISISHKNLEVFDYHNDVFGVDLMNAFGLFADYESRELFIKDRKFVKLTDLLDINSICNIKEKNIKKELEDVGKNLKELNQIDKGLKAQITIEICADILPIKFPAKCIPEKWRNEVNEMIDNMLLAGVIETSTSGWASPLKVEKEKNGKLRVVVDYSQINRFIEPAEISTTDLKEHLLYFPGAIFFSLIFIDKYHKLPIREGDRKITAFKTWRGLFQFRKLPYGLNANTIRYRHLNFYPTPCIQYTDSILICTRNINCHQIELKQVLECLINNGFTIDCQKSQFFRRKIIFKDFLFTWNGWHITPENKKIIDNFPIPKSKIETQFFLELVEKNKDFIPDLSSLTASLYKHIKSAQFPDWTEEVDEDFHKIKKSIKMARALHYPNDKVTFFLTPYVGAVQSVLIATLTQQRTPQIVVGYFSRPMKNEEEDFQGIQFVDHVVFERTMLAALAAMDYFSVYTKRFYLRLSKAAQVYLKKPVNEKFWKEKWKKYDFTIVPTVSD